MRFEDLGGYVALVPEDEADVKRIGIYVSSADPREPQNGALIAVGEPLTRLHTSLALEGLGALAASAANSSGVDAPELSVASSQEELDWSVNLADQDIAATLADPA